MLLRLAAILALSFSFFHVPAAMAGPNDVAIVIGNRDYQGNVPKVEFAQRDADAFAKAARDVLGVKPGNVVPLSNLTYSGFRRWFGPEGAGSNNLSQLVTASDTTIYVFYSGHGLPAEIGGQALKVLLPSDADPQEAAQDGYAIEWIRKAVRKVLQEKAPKGHAVLFFDACFSGSSAAGTLISKTSAVSIAASKIKETALDHVTELAATAADEVAYWDTERSHGAFTDALLDGLYGKAADASGAVNAGALAEFVRGRLNERLAYLYPSERKRQNPTLLGAASTRLASLSTTPPHRDEALAAEERTQCRILPVSSDEKAIRRFLSSCRECTCQETLDQRLRQLERLAAACAAEERQLTALTARGASAKNELEALQKSAECEAVRSNASRRIAALAPPANQSNAQLPATPAIMAFPPGAHTYFSNSSELCARATGDAAISACTQAIGLYPLNSDFVFNRAVHLAEKGERALAIADYSKAIALDPASYGAYGNRGREHLENKDYHLALADLSRSIELNPQHKYSWRNRGLTYENMGNYDKAISDYTHAIRLDPKYTAAYIDLADTYLKKNDVDKAVANYSTAIAQDPTSLRAYVAYLGRAKSYLIKGDKQRALADVHKALQIKPDSKEAKTLLARLQSRP